MKDISLERIINKENKLNLTFIMNEPTPYNYDLFNRLHQNSYDIEVFYLKKNNHYKFLSHDNSILPEKNFKSSINVTLMSKLKIIIHLMLLRQNSSIILWGYYPYTKIICFVACLLRKHKIYLFADSFPHLLGLKGKVKDIFRRWMCNVVDIVLVAGIQARMEAKRIGVLDTKCINFPYWFDTERISRNLDIQTEENKDENKNFRKIKFLVSSQLIQRKGVDIFIEALASIRTADFVCQIEGDGPDLEKLKGYVTSLRLESKVEFLGYCNLLEHYKNIHSADVICVPSRYDPWSIVVDEAMAFGKIVFTSDRVGCAVERIEHGVNGFIARAGDVDDYIRVLNKLIDMRAHWLLIGEAATKQHNFQSHRFLSSVKSIFGE